MASAHGDRQGEDFTIFLSPGMVNDLRAVAAERGLSVDSVVEQALGELFAIVERCVAEARDVERNANVEIE